MFANTFTRFYLGSVTRYDSKVCIVECAIFQMKLLMSKDLPTLEIRAKLADLRLDSFVRGNAFWKGDCVRLLQFLLQKITRDLQRS